MTQFAYVTPSEGGRVRMPDRMGLVMPAEGCFVPRTEYYERLIMTGDLKVDESRKPPVPEDQPEEAAAPEPPASEPEPVKQTGGVRK